MNFTESCDSASELSYVIFPYLFKRRNESNQFLMIRQYFHYRTHPRYSMESGGEPPLQALEVTKIARAEMKRLQVSGYCEPKRYKTLDICAHLR